MPADQAEVLPYPTCDGEPLPEGEVLAEGHLRSSPGMLEEVVERYEYRRRGCVIALTVHQAWSRGVSEAEVLFDLDYRPLRAWKRMTLPGATKVEDVRRYELRTHPPTMAWRGDEGLRSFWFRGEPPVAVIGPGRGVISAYVRGSRPLEVGETVRGPVLDFRRMVERVDTVALRRDADRDVPGLGRVRVYTVFGRESVFTDEEGWVVGDLAGLRPDAVLDTPHPAPLPGPATPPDPVGTP